MESSAPTAVTVLGGFLGAGKTTLLNALISAESSRGSGRRLGVLVNDFGSINIDAELVVGFDGDMISLGGGCICCSIREDMASSIFTMMQRGDAPEHLLHSTVELDGDWGTWSLSEPTSLLWPEEPWEGADLPVEPSVRGQVTTRVHQLRDPAVLDDDGTTWLLYTVAGESGIALAELREQEEAYA